ncbi:high mobility group B protein 14 [Apium graveolens]|uniref:high mobility group B protein 14 n=1 Tax=Apium graveolens TaxID=4045 RepID=UPI003D79D722
MVKKAKNSPAPSSTESSRKMVLRVRPPQKQKQFEDDVIEEPKSGKKPKSGVKKKAAKIDSDKPKKPPTAFFYYLEDFRKGFQEENPEVKSMRDVGKACGEKWKTMSYEEKVQYYDIATEKRAEFDRAMVDYIKRKESGEDTKPKDSDSEYDE